MIETPARVVRVEGGSAWVEPRAVAPAGGGRAPNVARLFRTREGHVRVADPLGAAPGDWVTVALPEKGVLKSALIAYLAPLAGLLAGAVLGAPAGETASVAAGVAGFALALFVVRRLGVRADASRFIPTIVAKLDSTSLPEKPCRSRS